MHDPRKLIMEMVEEGATKAEVAQALAIPENKMDSVLQQLREQATGLKEFESMVGTQNMRIKFKILQDLEEKVDANMLEPDVLLKFLALIGKEQQANVSEKGGLAEHLEEMMANEVVKAVAAKTVEDASKYRAMEQNAIDIEGKEIKKMPHI